MNEGATYREAGHAALLIAGAQGAAAATQAIDLAGARLLDRVDWADVPASLDAPAARPLLVLETAGWTSGCSRRRCRGSTAMPARSTCSWW
jgi:hypothetical protein